MVTIDTATITTWTKIGGTNDNVGSGTIIGTITTETMIGITIEIDVSQFSRTTTFFVVIVGTINVNPFKEFSSDTEILEGAQRAISREDPSLLRVILSTSIFAVALANRVSSRAQALFESVVRKGLRNRVERQVKTNFAYNGLKVTLTQYWNSALNKDSHFFVLEGPGYKHISKDFCTDQEANRAALNFAKRAGGK
jgi:hypothetical protein